MVLLAQMGAPRSTMRWSKTRGATVTVYEVADPPGDATRRETMRCPGPRLRAGATAASSRGSRRRRVAGEPRSGFFGDLAGCGSRIVRGLLRQRVRPLRVLPRGLEGLGDP